MNYDDLKLTAYALGEADEAIELDEHAAKIIAETALIASVLRAHYRRPRRRIRAAAYALAASVLVAVGIFLVSHRPVREKSVAVAPVDQPIVKVQASAGPILRLSPVLAEASEQSSLRSANFRGIHASDVEQLVAAVIEDASRVGAFTSLRLAPEAGIVW